jgi:hypothetical protein
MGLNDVQEGVLTIVFTVADKDALLLLDLDDLQAMLSNCAERADDLTTTYGNVSKQSIGAIQRSLLQLRSQGAEHFFGEPALEIGDMIATDDQGRGVVNILAADKLMASPKLYATFLLWLLSELFEQLPEVGDPDKPKLCFFFDEAHLLFDEAPPALLEKVEQVVRLIRSKGVGVYFITQNPVDVPDTVAAQLGNRVQHALRAFTPKDEKANRAAAETFRANPGVDVAKAITELKVGEALVSLLQADGAPSPVERGVLRETDAVGKKYDAVVDRESAEELLAAKSQEAAAAAAAAKAQTEAEKAAALQAKEEARQAKEAERARIAAEREAAKPGMMDKIIVSATRSASSSIGRQVANELGRAVFGGTSRRRSNGGLVGGLLRGVLGNLLR